MVRTLNTARRAPVFALWTLLVLGASTLARAGDAPPAPTAPPAAPPSPTSAEAMEERLRKMEEANRELLRQFGGLVKKNEELSRTVKDLSAKLERSGGPDLPAPTGNSPPRSGPGGAEPEPAPDDPNITPEPLTGGLTSPSKPDAAARAGQSRLPLKAFNDQSYRQRYGFVLQSENDEFELRFNGLVQTDARIDAPHQPPANSDIDIPRARMWFSGRLTKPVEYQISFQRSTNSFDILNAYLNLHYDDRLQLRIGRFRAPYTYEWAKLSIWEMITPERSPFAINFGPNRQVGLMAWGNVAENRLEYAVGIFDGPRNSYQDFNAAKDVMAFVDFRPFYREDGDSILNAFSIGGSLDAGRQDNPLAPAALRSSITASGNTLSSTSGDNLVASPFLVFNSNVRERGNRDLWELHATYFYKQLALLGAWDAGRNDMSQTGIGARPVHLPVSGYFVQASYMLTGETRDKLTLVQPLKPLSFKDGSFGLGAVELQARYSELEVGQQVFSAGLADPNLWTRRADFIDAGVNWYLNKYVKLMFDWQHAMYANPLNVIPGPIAVKNSDLYWLRFQVYF